MSAPIEDIFSTAPQPPLRVELEPAHNAVINLLVLEKTMEAYGFGEWVTRTLLDMSPEERRTNTLVMIGLYYAVIPVHSWPSFPAYLAHLESLSPLALRDKMLDAYASFSIRKQGTKKWQYEERSLSPDEKTHILASFDNYISFLRLRFDESHIDVSLESQAYRYACDPDAMQELILGHLHHMWEKYLEPEWPAERALLLSSVNAFSSIDLNSMSRLEAARLVTGQELESEKWDPIIKKASEIIFVPSAHIGPYLWRWGNSQRSFLIFGARQPAGLSSAVPDLSRAEIIVRLSALADDSRLRILSFIAENGEQSAKEIIQKLDVSQSAASRHLQQLTATGFLAERRCEGAKCYRLNPERIADTLNAVAMFLNVSPVQSRPDALSVPQNKKPQRL